MNIKVSWQRSALIVFTSTLLLLCIVLAVFAIREVEREKLVRENEIKEDYQIAADFIAAEIKSTLNELESKINLRIESLSSSNAEDLIKLFAQIQNEEGLIAETFLVSEKTEFLSPFLNLFTNSREQHSYPHHLRDLKSILSSNRPKHLNL